MVRNAAAWTADLVGLLALAGAATAVLELGVDSTVVRTALLAPLVLLGPGYALLAAAFPERRVPGPTEPAAGTVDAVAKPSPRSLPPTFAGRVGLAVVASLVVVAAAALATVYAGGLDAESVLLATSAVTGGGALLALARRAALDPPRRFSLDALGSGVPFGPRRPKLGSGGGGSGRVANAVLVAGVLALVAATAFAATAAPATESFSEFYVVSPDGSGGFTASDYPRVFPGDDGRPVVARVANHEGRATTYTVVAAVQRVDAQGGTADVTSQRELGRARTEVAAGDTGSVRFEPAPDLRGERVRLAFFLYVGDAPPDPSAATAYRTVHYEVTTAGGR